MFYARINRFLNPLLFIVSMEEVVGCCILSLTLVTSASIILKVFMVSRCRNCITTTTSVVCTNGNILIFNHDLAVYFIFRGKSETFRYELQD